MNWALLCSSGNVTGTNPCPSPGELVSNSERMAEEHESGGMLSEKKGAKLGTGSPGHMADREQVDSPCPVPPLPPPHPEAQWAHQFLSLKEGQ